ncbi:NAD-dependent epimerase/dehydratase family protein [Microlunatus flavus]|uniref:Nucleoside-diphosphate-sugar epimerase n=1 Tax=Microlunatus flavus TaxID=1036181 RepID=A0A1H9MTE7_9ACTN|nr:NAD(P)-dependent oxidoreductase [Microlunatus flavus]SER26871.1 Nucleoside-diphosphate-sugar epimerase [Microlunatus flavus]
MSTLLLTGASGLVGARLLPRLVAAGFECRALVRGEHPLPPEVVAVRGDLADPDSLRAAVEGVDLVVHLAALFRTQDEAAIWRANLDGTRNLLSAVEAYAPRARVVMASTGNVYDADAARPALETDACAPTAAYPASKVAAERLLRESGLTWAVLRLPFVYGEGDGHLASLAALAPRFGLHPAHTYSVAHHRDVAAAVLLAAEGRMDGRVVNLTDDAAVTVFELARYGGVLIEGSAEPLVDPWSGRMDGSLIRELGFVPVVPTVAVAAREGSL